MVRIIGLICVFGIASLCLAVTIHVTTSYAQGPDDCPCWGTPDGLEQLLGSPDSITPDDYFVCDTGVHIKNSTIRKEFYADIFIDDTHNVHVTVTKEESRGMCTRIGKNHRYKVSIFADEDQAQACLDDIFAYCCSQDPEHPGC